MVIMLRSLALEINWTQHLLFMGHKHESELNNSHELFRWGKFSVQPCSHRWSQLKLRLVGTLLK